MSNKTIYYAIVNNFGFDVMRVTSETDKHIYGSVRSVGVHYRRDLLKAKFETLEAAEAARVDIKKIVDKFSQKYKDVNRYMNQLHREEHEEIETLLKSKGS